MTVQTLTRCPECAGATPLGDDVLLGEIVQCPDCGLELEIVALTPLALAPAPEVEEDWGE